MPKKSFLSGMFGGSSKTVKPSTPKTVMPTASTTDSTPFSASSRIKQVTNIKQRNANIMKAMFGD
jgi:hypothetical protein